MDDEEEVAIKVSTYSQIASELSSISSFFCLQSGWGILWELRLQYVGVSSEQQVIYIPLTDD
jgi:hypothetical protein